MFDHFHFQDFSYTQGVVDVGQEKYDICPISIGLKISSGAPIKIILSDFDLSHFDQPKCYMKLIRILGFFFSEVTKFDGIF